ncbi:hypothetical protein WKV44_10475 [Spirochaetia bacterium 38H-sp]|uniref:LAGLIDADG homing endonuclease n=1 Tax=Rarispira pelagica TaxID=3141764 RepID=A0ABU9UE69_9SPIR
MKYIDPDGRRGITRDEKMFIVEIFGSIGAKAIENVRIESSHGNRAGSMKIFIRFNIL